MSSAADIFARALEQPAERRQAFVARCTRDETTLRLEVESLLSSYGAMGAFLDTDTAGGGFAPEVAEPERDAVPGHELVRKLGEGGFGTVHLARERGTLRRDVAIKFLKRDRISEQALERFDTERQILANLQHDGIARIFSAGTASAGCPYYTMEWVDGPPLDEHCDRLRLSVEERVALLVRVARAVAYAHQRGVIHGDLKPRNVLVCSVDGEPSPKVIDFGVARTLGGPTRDASPFGAPAGTPRYMSPEQRAGAPADTRSDVFALGVMLHELVAGPGPRGPVDSSTRTTLGALDPAELARRASARSTSPRGVARALRGDLDDVVRTATALDPEARHASVRDLIADLEAWRGRRSLQSQPFHLGRAVLKLLGRHRAVSALGLLLVALAAGFLVRAAYVDRLAQVELARAEAETDAALREAQEWTLAAEGTLAFLDDVLLAAAPGREGADVLLLDVVDAAERRFETAPPELPLVASRVAMTLGRLPASLQQTDRAEALLRQALALLEGMEPPNRRALGATRLELARVIGTREHTEESQALLQQALLELDPDADRRKRLDARATLAFAELDQGRPQAFLEALRAVHADALAEHGPEDLATRSIALMLANAERNHGDPTQGRRLREDPSSLDVGDASAGFHTRLSVRVSEARERYDGGDYAAADRLAEDVLATLAEKGLQRGSPEGLAALNVLAGSAQRRGDFERALELTREQFELQLARHGPDARGTRTAAGSVAAMLVNLRRGPEALEFLDRHVPLDGGDALDPRELPTLEVRAFLLQRVGRVDEALELFDRIVATSSEHYGPDQPHTLEVRRQRAGTLAGHSRHDEALDELGAVHAACVRHFGESHREVLATEGRIARVLASSGRLDDAAALLEERLARALDAHGPDHGTVREALNDLASFAKAYGRPALVESARETVRLAGADAP